MGERQQQRRRQVHAPRTSRHRRNKDDLEIVNGTTWNENIVCVRDVVTTADNYRGLLFQQPYGAIAQLPGWSAGFSVSGTHTIYNALELLNGRRPVLLRQDRGDALLLPARGREHGDGRRRGARRRDVIAIAGTSNTNRVKNLTFQGITFANTDYSLYAVAGSHGKATVQGATVYVAYGDGNWHNSKYEITDTLPGMITVNSADSISSSATRSSTAAAKGISMINDVVNSTIVGNYHHRHRGQRRHGRAIPSTSTWATRAPTRSTRPGSKASAPTTRSRTTSSTTSARSRGSAATPASPRSSSAASTSRTTTSTRPLTTASTWAGGGRTSRTRPPARTTRSTTTVSSTR